MIHAKNGRGKAAAVAVEKPAERTWTDVEKLEREVGKWIKQNPLLGVGIALSLGLGLGLLLKRRR
jgi:ElaB/YqjD/DUF883 family membrane-anchored ribosome-binding protein